MAAKQANSGKESQGQACYLLSIQLIIHFTKYMNTLSFMHCKKFGFEVRVQ